MTAEPWQNVVAMAAPVQHAPEARSESIWSGVAGWDALLPRGGTAAGAWVTPDSALGLTSAFAAINTIATDIASLPLKLYRKHAGGGRDEVPDHPAAMLMAESPDGETTSMRWFQAHIGHVLGWGNGYGEIEFDRSGYPTGVYLTDPSRTVPRRRPQDKVLYYDLGNGALPPYRMLHTAGLGFDGLVGYSPIAKAREAVGLALAAEQYGAGMFGNGARPGGVLKTPRKLKDDAVKNIRESWEAIHRGAGRSGKVAVLEDGLEWQTISISPEDAQFLATRQFQVIEIARMFRLPPSKIGDYSDAHYANLESANLDYMTTVLMPWCEAIERELCRKLLTTEERRAGFYFEFQMAAFLRGDMKSQAEYFTKLRDLGVFSPNEIRSLLNLNPVDGGDVRLVPQSMTSLENAGKPAALPAPKSDPAQGGGTSNG